jgi:pimeloyl-ACP methyl ester carboxylesterase
MAFVRVGDIELCYETFGRHGDPPILLVAGLGSQLLSFDEALCTELAERGCFVIRYDNRDAGLSTQLDELGPPDLEGELAGRPVSVPYGLEALADDAAGLLEALGAVPATVVGVSMGGMVAQLVAIRHPTVVRALCSIMSTTGDRTVGQPTPEGIALLLEPAPEGRDEAIEASVRASKVLAGGGFPFDEARTRARAAAAYDRARAPDGAGRQLLAILRAPDRSAALRQLALPTLVIHGDADPLISPSGGAATAAAIPGARLVMVPGMGHELPEGIWPLLVDELVGLAR